MSEERAKLAALLAQLRSRARLQFDLRRFCFPEQLAFIHDPSPFKTAVCSRRSGKTIACAADLVDTALANPGRVCLYITLSRINAKRIIWGEILAINEKFRLQGKINETELSMRFPNGSVIYLSGAKDKSEIEKFRGLPIAKCYIDECQSFRAYIQNLIDEVISKALFDYNGTLCLIGTPGPVPTGYFHECAHSPNWSHHAWTMFQNPHLEKKSGKTVLELVEQDMKRKGVSIDDPTIQRECFGRWTIDINSLVFRYDETRNNYDQLPSLPGHWDYVIGVDLGYDDSDAIAVLGWHPKVKEAYLIEEIVQPKQGITELAAQLDTLYRRYNPLKIVMDTGGLGKKIAEEIQRRYSIPIQAAEKSRKYEFIEILNDAMRTSRFFAQRRSRFAQDCFLVEWDKDSQELKISDNYHSDITDAVLYAFRESLHWLYEPEAPKIAPQTPEWFKRQEEEMESLALRSLQSRNQEDDWTDYNPWNG